MTRRTKPRALAATFAVAATAALASAAGAGANTYCVGTPSCSGIPEGNLQTALSAASADTQPDRIELGAGTFGTATGFTYDGLGAGNTLEIVGAGRNVTNISGTVATNGRSLLDLRGDGPTKISDVTIQSGAPSDPTFAVGTLKIFGSAERVDVKAGPRNYGVELRQDSALRGSNVELSDISTGVRAAVGNASVVNSTIAARHGGQAAAAQDTGVLTVSHSRLDAVGTGAEAANGGTLKIDDSLVYGSDYALLAYSQSTLEAANVTATASGADAETVAARAPDGTAHLTLENSAVSGGAYSLVRTQSGTGTAFLTVRHSAYDHATATEYGAGSIDSSDANLDLTDPGFVDAAAGDYHLRSDSPLRDQGSASPLGGLASTDLDGTARSLDGNGDGVAVPDIGAFEFDPGTPASSGSGSASGALDAPPVIIAARLTHRRFAVGRARTAVSASVKHGTKFRLTLSENARVKIQLRKAGGRKAGALRRSVHAGSNRIAFSGRVGRRTLKPGRYVAVIRATDGSGQHSAARKLKFKVLKG